MATVNVTSIPDELSGDFRRLVGLFTRHTISNPHQERWLSSEMLYFIKAARDPMWEERKKHGPSRCER